MPAVVLHLCDKFGVEGSSIHGVTRLFSWWFPRFDKSRFEVTLAGLKRPEPASQRLVDEGVPITHFGRGPFDPRLLADIVGLVRRRNVRILHVHGYAASDFGRLAARITGARLVLHEHFADPKLPPHQALADRVLSRLTDRAIAVSGSTREFLVRERFVPRERVRLVWNGAPLDEFAPVSSERGRAVRGKLGIPDTALVVGAIGRLNPQKGHRYLLDAAPAVLARHPDARFLIVGDGDLLKSLRAQAVSLGVSDRVVFAGHRGDVPDVLGAIDVLCIASLYEGTPLTLFEAMASRKAVVSTSVDGCREVIVDAETGLLVAPGDPAALAIALGRALGDRDLRDRLGANALAASRNYDVNACVRQIEEVYQELLAA
jgi:glycosyltransferase involved in cell wall biosynthesis